MSGSTREARRGGVRLEPLSRALDRYLEASGLQGALERTGLLDEWSRVVGPRIAAVTRAAEVRGETLVVEVASSAWLNELTMMRKNILERLNGIREGVTVEQIRFRLAPTSPGIDGDHDMNQRLEGRHG